MQGEKKIMPVMLCLSNNNTKNVSISPFILDFDGINYLEMRFWAHDCKLMRDGVLLQQKKIDLLITES
jgi:hypothetical protein